MPRRRYPQLLHCASSLCTSTATLVHAVPLPFLRWAMLVPAYALTGYSHAVAANPCPRLSAQIHSARSQFPARQMGTYQSCALPFQCVAERGFAALCPSVSMQSPCCAPLCQRGSARFQAAPVRAAQRLGFAFPCIAKAPHFPSRQGLSGPLVASPLPGKAHLG